jgi:hypothetical protein
MLSDASANGVYKHAVAPYVYFTNEADANGSHHPFMVIACYSILERPHQLLDIHRPPGAPQHWYARLRRGSVRGNYSIKVYGLNRSGLLGLRTDYIVNNIRTPATKLKQLLESKRLDEARSAFEEAQSKFAVPMPYAALSYDAYRHYVPDATLQVIQKAWPKPEEVGLPRAVRPIRRKSSS